MSPAVNPTRISAGGRELGCCYFSNNAMPPSFSRDGRCYATYYENAYQCCAAAATALAEGGQTGRLINIFDYRMPKTGPRPNAVSAVIKLYAGTRS